MIKLNNRGKTYRELTWSGRFRRIYALAVRGLEQYRIGPFKLRPLSFGTNLLYRVAARNGKRYVLRMAWPGWRSREDLTAEALWLRALAQQTDIGAPVIIPACSGESVIALTDPGIEGTWHGMLMNFIPGRLLRYYLTATNVGKMGELFAKLHIHAAGWNPPNEFKPKVFDGYLSRGEQELLFDERFRTGIDGNAMAVLKEMRKRVEEEYSNLERGDLRVIHCDLWHDNIKLHNGRLRPFDFEDTIIGFRLHDMAMGLLDLLETVGYDGYCELFPAFRSGYENYLEWPKGSLETLQAGRMLWQLNHSARYEPAAFPGMVRRYAETFRFFHRTGLLKPI